MRSRTSAPDLTGRTVLVTGANSGIGLATAADLAALGATVVMTARDVGKGEAARAEVVRRSGNDQVVLGNLDLASLASVRRFAAWFLDEFGELHVLVNNAGLITDERRETTDGFETMFGVNHLGHFLLTDLLRDRLVASAPSRVVVVTSVAHRWVPGGLDRGDLQSTRSFRGAKAYGRSKLANVLFARELARQLVGTGVTVNAVHPGSVNTHFGTDGDTGAMAWWITTFGRYVLRTPEQGARTSVLLASSEELDVAGTTGGYWSHGRRWQPSRAGRDAEAGRWLWAESARLVGLQS